MSRRPTKADLATTADWGWTTPAHQHQLHKAGQPHLAEFVKQASRRHATTKHTETNKTIPPSDS